MLLIKTELHSSPIHGLGVFTLEEIPKGLIIWRFQKDVDVLIHSPENLPTFIQDFLKTYAFPSDLGGLILSCDNDRFQNHSDNPNVGYGSVPKRSRQRTFIALHNIAKGEELTIDYNTIGGI